MIRGFPVESGSPMDLLLGAAKRMPKDDEIVTCSDCGQRVPYGYIGQHLLEPVHPDVGLAPDWCTRLVCRDCEYAAWLRGRG